MMLHRILFLCLFFFMQAYGMELNDQPYEGLTKEEIDLLKQLSDIKKSVMTKITELNFSDVQSQAKSCSKILNELQKSKNPDLLLIVHSRNIYAKVAMKAIRLAPDDIKQDLARQLKEELEQWKIRKYHASLNRIINKPEAHPHTQPPQMDSFTVFSNYEEALKYNSIGQAKPHTQPPKLLSFHISSKHMDFNDETNTIFDGYQSQPVADEDQTLESEEEDTQNNNSNTKMSIPFLLN